MQKNNYSKKVLNEKNIQKMKSIQNSIKQKNEKKAISFYCPLQLVEKLNQYSKTHTNPEGRAMARSQIIELALNEMLFQSDK